MCRFTIAIGKQFNHSPTVPNLSIKWCQCISKIILALKVILLDRLQGINCSVIQEP